MKVCDTELFRKAAAGCDWATPEQIEEVAKEVQNLHNIRDALNHTLLTLTLLPLLREPVNNVLADFVR